MGQSPSGVHTEITSRLLWKWTKSWWNGVVCSVYFGNHSRVIFIGCGSTGPSMTVPTRSTTSGTCPAACCARSFCTCV